ncbi:MAG: hypothetical protein ACT4OM_02500 [Actinomycetota bacterium]
MIDVLNSDDLGLLPTGVAIKSTGDRSSLVSLVARLIAPPWLVPDHRQGGSLHSRRSSVCLEVAQRGRPNVQESVAQESGPARNGRVAKGRVANGRVANDGPPTPGGLARTGRVANGRVAKGGPPTPGSPARNGRVAKGRVAKGGLGLM